MLIRLKYFLTIAGIVLVSSCLKDPLDDTNFSNAINMDSVTFPESIIADGKSIYKLNIPLSSSLKDTIDLIVETTFGTLSKSLTFSAQANNLTGKIEAENFVFYLMSSNDFTDSCRLSINLGNVEFYNLTIPVTPAYPDDFFIEAPATLDTTGSADIIVHLFRNLGKATNSIKADLDTINTSGALSLIIPEFAYSSDTIIKAQINTVDSDTGSFDLKVSVPLNGGGILVKTKHLKIE